MGSSFLSLFLRSSHLTPEHHFVFSSISLVLDLPWPQKGNGIAKLAKQSQMQNAVDGVESVVLQEGERGAKEGMVLRSQAPIFDRDLDFILANGLHPVSLLIPPCCLSLAVHVDCWSYGTAMSAMDRRLTDEYLSSLRLDPMRQQSRWIPFGKKG